MALHLDLHTIPDVPLETEVLSPERLTGLSVREIVELPVHHGSHISKVGDFFHVRGECDGELRLQGELQKVKLLGAGMSSGRLIIHGDAGTHLGWGMSGGEIIVEGDGGDWVGPEMTGGRILIKGNAGHMTGSAYRGQTVGLLGGEIIVQGNVGNETGNGMRRGLIAVGGNAGDFTGVNMLAGTIIVLGDLGGRTGASMKRGSIVSMNNAEMLPTFSYDCLYSPMFLRLYLIHLQQQGLPIENRYITGKYRRYSGDAIELNRGEVLMFEQ